MFNVFRQSKRTMSTDSLPDMHPPTPTSLESRPELKQTDSTSPLPPAQGKREGKENRHERMKSASAVLTSQKDDGNKVKAKGGKTWTGPPPVLESSTGTNDSRKGKELKSVTMGRAQGKVDRELLVKQGEVQEAFDKMLDDLQIPDSLRPRLNTMELNVKAEMLKSSKTLDLFAATNPSLSLSGTTKSLRKTRSDDSLALPAAAARSGSPVLGHRKRKAFDSPPATPKRRGSKPPFEIVDGASFSMVNVSTEASPPATSSSKNNNTGGSSRPTSKHISQFPSMSSLADLTDAPPKPVKSRLNSKEKALAALTTPSAFASLLANTSATKLDVERVKKLRLMLRNEPASWTEEWLCHGGYVALLGRVKELLNVEWRDEQHDDQTLHELLRCLKALSTSSIGSFALRSSCPTPWASLIELMYSDKKPGDVATRQLVIELFLVLFDLYPSRASRSAPGTAPSTPGTPTRRGANSLYPLPPGHDTLFSLLRTLLLTPAPPSSEAHLSPPALSQHTFISASHTPRIFKTYLAEMSDVCRDYFWVFCHPGNGLWVLGEVDEPGVERPKAPGGMTGGVEWEAMGYLTTHLRFLNAMSKAAAEQGQPGSGELGAKRFHEDLFASGLERILATVRKASTTYYPTLHLEIARYIAHTTRAGFELPYSLSRLVSHPPTPVRKQNLATPERPTTGGQGQGRSPGRRPQGGRPPMLPVTPRLEAIRM